MCEQLRGRNHFTGTAPPLLAASTVARRLAHADCGSCPRGAHFSACGTHIGWGGGRGPELRTRGLFLPIFWASFLTAFRPGFFPGKKAVLPLFYRAKRRFGVGKSVTAPKVQNPREFSTKMTISGVGQNATPPSRFAHPPIEAKSRGASPVYRENFAHLCHSSLQNRGGVVAGSFQAGAST